MKKIGIGIIGCGFMGKTHSFGAKTIPLYYDNLPFLPCLVGACDSNLEAARSMKEKNGFEFATSNLDELLSHKDIDVVTISTPNIFHKDIILAALKAGKHIYADKPLTASYKEALELIEPWKKTGVAAQVVHQFRFSPAVMRAKQLISEGRIGNIISFHGAYLHSGSIAKNKPIGWKQDKAMGGGGVLFDLGSHILDLLHYLLGEYSEIFASTRILYPERPNAKGEMVKINADDSALILCRLPNGAQGMVEASKIATGTNDDLSFEIYGDKGAVRFNSISPNWLEYFDNEIPEKALGGERGYKKIQTMSAFEKPGGLFPPSKFPLGWLRSHVHCFYNFLNCVHNGSKAFPSFEDGAYILKVLEAAYESADRGVWINI